MKNVRKFHRVKPVAAACLCAALLGGATAYAADVGGIQTKIQLWMNGELQDAEVTQRDDNSYTFTFRDKNGETQAVTGGGVTIDADGTETPASASEVAEGFESNVDVGEDGRVYLYYRDHTIDVTDAIQANGTAKIAVTDGDETMYFDITEEDGSYPYTEGTEPTGNASDYTQVK